MRQVLSVFILLTEKNKYNYFTYRKILTPVLDSLRQDLNDIKTDKFAYCYFPIPFSPVQVNYEW